MTALAHHDALQAEPLSPYITARYDKFAVNFLAMVQLASMRLWLRAYESTAWFAPLM